MIPVPTHRVPDGGSPCVGHDAAGPKAHATAGRYRDLMTGAFVLINADGDRIAELGRELAGIEGVAGAYSVAGDVDLVAVLRVAEPEQVATIVTGRIAKLPGVQDTRTLIAFRSYSGDDIAAAYEGMED